jgi:hypothetical protein
MNSGMYSIRGIKFKSALEAINNKCISVPVSEAGLIIDVTKLINVVTDEIRTTESEMTALDLITSAATESGYEIIVKITNDNKLEITPINYKKAPAPKTLFSFLENLSAQDIVSNKSYGEETTNFKNKRIVVGDNISYLTTVRDHPIQQSNVLPPALGPDICCLPDGSYVLSTSAEDCFTNDGGNAFWTNTSLGFLPCVMQPVCSIKYPPGSIGAYSVITITPTPEPNP